MNEQTSKQRSALGLIGRFFVIAIAFFLALAIALTVLMALGSYWMGEELREGQDMSGDWGQIVSILSMLMGGASFLVVTTPILSVLPAIVLIIIGEVAQLRSFYYYVIGGGLAMVTLPFLATPAGTAFNPQMMSVFATAGFAGGLLYWLLAGRNA
jgi:uncharacterized membrane protein (DUF485 family)